jgi:hypothetical protein
MAESDNSSVKFVSADRSDAWARSVDWRQVDRLSYESWHRLALYSFAGVVLAGAFYASRWIFALVAGGSLSPALTERALERADLLTIFGVFATMAFTVAVSQAFLGRATNAENVVVTIGLHRAIEALSIVASTALVLFVASEIGAIFETGPSVTIVLDSDGMEISNGSRGGSLGDSVVNVIFRGLGFASVYFAIAIVGFVPKRVSSGSKYRKFFLRTRQLERMCQMSPGLLGQSHLDELHNVKAVRTLRGASDGDHLVGAGGTGRPARRSPAWRRSSPADQGCSSLGLRWMFWDLFPFMLGFCAALVVSVEQGTAIIRFWLAGEVGLALSLLVLIGFRPYVGTAIARLTAGIFVVVAAIPYLSVMVEALKLAREMGVVSVGPVVFIGFALIIRVFQTAIRFVKKPSRWLANSDLISRLGGRMIRRLADGLLVRLKVERFELWGVSVNA